MAKRQRLTLPARTRAAREPLPEVTPPWLDEERVAALRERFAAIDRKHARRRSGETVEVMLTKLRLSAREVIEVEAEVAELGRGYRLAGTRLGQRLSCARREVERLTTRLRAAKVAEARIEAALTGEEPA